MSLSLAFHCPAKPLNKVTCAVIGQEASKWVGQPCLSCCFVHVPSSSLLLFQIITHSLYHFCTFMPFKNCLSSFQTTSFFVIITNLLPFLLNIAQPVAHCQNTHPHPLRNPDTQSAHINTTTLFLSWTWMMSLKSHKPQRHVEAATHTLITAITWARVSGCTVFNSRIFLKSKREVVQITISLNSIAIFKNTKRLKGSS